MSIRDRVVELRRVRAGDLKPHPSNWRKHPPRQRAAMRAALDEIGCADALLVRETPDGLQIIDGHLRAEITAKDEVPVLVLDLDDAETTKLLLTLDPLASLAESDDALRAELAASVEWLDAELAELARGPGLVASVTEDEVPDPPETPTTKPGDLYVLGEHRHRLLCGDSTDPDSVARVLDGAEPLLMHFDPPFDGPLGSWPVPASAVLLASWSRGANTLGWNAAAMAKWSVCEFVFHGGPARGQAAAWFPCATHELMLLAWRKGALKRWDTQPLALSGARLTTDGRPFSAQEATAARSGALAGPYQKPMMAYFLALSRVPPGSACWDPTAGVGGVVVAAEQCARRALAIELDPGNCDVICARWEKLTGQVVERIRA